MFVQWLWKWVRGQHGQYTNGEENHVEEKTDFSCLTDEMLQHVLYKLATQAGANHVRNVRLVSKRWCALATDVLLADTAVSKLPPPALPSLSRRFFNSEQHGHITTHHEVSMSRNPAVTRRKGARARARGRGQAAQWLSQLQSPTDPSTIASLLAADLHTIGAPCLPQNIAELDVLQGCFVLQADEVVNIAAPARDRYRNGGSTRDGPRTLKLLLTDGHRHVPAIELQPCPQLQADLPAGCKVAIKDVPVHRGVLLLTPTHVTVLGGQVQALQEARQRMLTQYQQPIHKRRSAAERDVYAAARAAAWGPSPPGQQHHAGAPPQQPPMSMPTTETTREDQSVTTRLPLTAIPTNTMMTHQSMATQGPPQGPSQQQQHCAPAPQQNPAPLHDVIQSTQPPLQDVAACSTVPVSYVPATAEPTPAHHHTPCPTHDEGVDVVQDASNAETHAPSAVQQAGSPSTAGPTVIPLARLLRHAGKLDQATIRATVYSLAGELCYWDHSAGQPTDEFSLSVILEDGVCADAVLSHSLLAQLLGYPTPAAFASALQQADPNATRAVERLSAHLQGFVGMMNVQHAPHKLVVLNF